MDEQQAPTVYRAADWPTELANPRDVLGNDMLNADGRAKLVATEVPFVITSAERFFWQDGKEAVRFTAIIAPDDDHDTPWHATLALSLPEREAEDTKRGDREMILAYFEGHGDGARPVGPFVGVHVQTTFPQPYFALRAATQKQIAAHSLNISALRSDRAANVTKTDGKGNRVG